MNVSDLSEYLEPVRLLSESSYHPKVLEVAGMVRNSDVLSSSFVHTLKFLSGMQSVAVDTQLCVLYNE